MITLMILAAIVFISGPLFAYHTVYKDDNYCGMAEVGDYSRRQGAWIIVFWYVTIPYYLIKKIPKNITAPIVDFCRFIKWLFRG